MRGLICYVNVALRVPLLLCKAVNVGDKAGGIYKLCFIHYQLPCLALGGGGKGGIQGHCGRGMY